MMMTMMTMMNDDDSTLHKALQVDAGITNNNKVVVQ